MTQIGHIRNGAIVLDKPIELPDGSQVEVDVKPVKGNKVDLADLLKAFEGIEYDFDALEKLREASKL